MTIQQAIQKAVGKGYKDYIETASSFDIDKERSDILLDPLFWQALGKSMGWESIRVHKKYDGLQGGVWGDEEKWLHEWHRLIDHLAEGKSIEDYFKNL